MLFFEAGGMCSYHGASVLVNKWSVVCVNSRKLNYGNYYYHFLASAIEVVSVTLLSV